MKKSRGRGLGRNGVKGLARNPGSSEPRSGSGVDPFCGSCRVGTWVTVSHSSNRRWYTLDVYHNAEIVRAVPSFFDFKFNTKVNR